MATSAVDQKILGRVARSAARSSPTLSSSLYQILGLSVILSDELFVARRRTRLDPTANSPTLLLYHHVLWLSREGLQIAESLVFPHTQSGQFGFESQVLCAKLRASIYHVFCLYHNRPPIAHVPSSPTFANQSRYSPSASPTPRRAATLRDPIPSMNSETSYVTNPYAGPSHSPPVSMPSASEPHHQMQIPAYPPGLAPHPIEVPLSSSFILPSRDFVPLAQAAFSSCYALAQSLLPGLHPLRLSVALEYAAFLWDCVHKFDSCRRLAREAAKAAWADPAQLSDAEFEDSAKLVGVLDKMALRGSPTPNRRRYRNEAIRGQQELSSDEETVQGAETKKKEIEAIGEYNSLGVKEGDEGLGVPTTGPGRVAAQSPAQHSDTSTEDMRPLLARGSSLSAARPSTRGKERETSSEGAFLRQRGLHTRES